MALIDFKYVVIFHFLLALWGMYGPIGISYAISNFALGGIGCWAIATFPDLESFTIYGITFIFTILNDIMSVSIYDHEVKIIKYGKGFEKFGLGMAIMNLILKTASIYLLYGEYHTRLGGKRVVGSVSGSGYEPFPRSTAGSTAVFGPISGSGIPPTNYQPAPNSYQPAPNSYQPAPGNYQPAPNNFQADSTYQRLEGNTVL